ncbi:MAG: glycosyltransferase family 4 protein [Methanothrix sp.]|jgi:glycosyltransferase involved in cell wall biosynthesis|nr:glycosyltransferase family 4 protein [Methanothrix sp.]
MVDMNILIVVNNFFPEIGSAAHIYFDLAKAFVKRGHEIDVITSYPRKFNLAKVDQERTFPLDEEIDGIKIHRSKHISLRDNMIVRGGEHFLCPIYYLHTYFRLKKKFDSCLVYIPPLPLYFFARMIKSIDGTPSVLNYQDFHPQELTDVGVLKNCLVINIMKYIEGQSYKKADFITVLSEGGIDYIASRGGDPSKIEHIYNGCMISDANEPLAKMSFKETEGIEDKILISYAGILSPFQGLDNILNAAKELKVHEDLIFYLVGDGLIRDHLAQRIKNEDISNVRLLPLQPREDYLNIINSSDISIVSLDHRMKAPCIPGKLVNLMAMKKALIAIVPEDSETAKVIRRSKNGVIVEPGDVEELKRTILHFGENMIYIQAMGENGNTFLKTNMDLNKIVLRYEEIFKSIKAE